LKARERAGQGASVAAIQKHYDLSNEFYRLWLDDSLTYSCALWEEGDTLESAQLRKLDFHAAQIGARGARRVLDVGCGWGSMLNRLVKHWNVERAVGLTLSETQLKHIESESNPRIDVVLESWDQHAPRESYEGIVCIGAVEHFVRPETPAADRVATYRRFFSDCHRLLRPGGSMSLQTIAYGVGGFVTGAISAIFPESDLPTLGQLVEASEGLFEIVTLRNDRKHYALTCREWLSRLRSRRGEAEMVVGEAVARHYDRFLDASSRGFDSHVFCLFRIHLRRID
jgi:cyclopropane-fatty-acyl-phospholipid synthase